MSRVYNYIDPKSRYKINCLPFEAQLLVQNVFEVAKINGISIKLFDLNRKKGDLGHFDPTNKEIMCCTRHAEEKWLAVFIHEACHMEQWIENSPLSQKFYRMDDIDTWLDGKEEWHMQKITKTIEVYKRYELDCEKRTVKKIASHGLTHIINTDKYIRKANMYIHMHSCLKYTRSWPCWGRSKEFWYGIWSKMSPVWEKDYKKIPDIMVEKLIKKPAF